MEKINNVENHQVSRARPVLGRLWRNGLLRLGTPRTNRVFISNTACRYSWSNVGVVVTEDPWLRYRSDWNTAHEDGIEFGVLWSGETAGSRSLIMSGEESVSVYIRIYFLSNVDCLFNGSESYLAGITRAIPLAYNTTYSLTFMTPANKTWVYNVHTELEHVYSAFEMVVTLDMMLQGFVQVWQQNIIAALIGVVTGISIRRMPRPKKDKPEILPKPSNGSTSHFSDKDEKNGKTSQDTYYVEAPVTGWGLLYRSRFYLVLALGVLVYFISPVSLDPNMQFPFYTWLAVCALTWWMSGRRVGFALDTRDLANGFVDLQELDSEEVDMLAPNAMVVTSPLGVVILRGHRLFSTDKVHSMLEVQTNSGLIDEIVTFQKDLVPKFLEYERTIDITTQKLLNIDVNEWLKLMRLDPADKKQSIE